MLISPLPPAHFDAAIELYYLAVKPTARGRGHSRAMMQACGGVACRARRAQAECHAPRRHASPRLLHLAWLRAQRRGRLLAHAPATQPSCRRASQSSVAMMVVQARFSLLLSSRRSTRSPSRTTRRCATVAGPTPSTWSDTWRGRAGCRPGGGARTQRARLRRGAGRTYRSRPPTPAGARSRPGTWRGHERRGPGRRRGWTLLALPGGRGARRGLEELHRERFVHRRPMSGEPIEYTAVRGRRL